MPTADATVRAHWVYRSFTRESGPLEGDAEAHAGGADRSCEGFVDALSRASQTVADRIARQLRVDRYQRVGERMSWSVVRAARDHAYRRVRELIQRAR